MAEPPRSTSGAVANDEGTELLLMESGDRERSRRLHFDGSRPSEPREKPNPRLPRRPRFVSLIYNSFRRVISAARWLFLQSVLGRLSPIIPPIHVSICCLIRLQ